MIKKIKLCCNPVLPTVYDDSLSYYEVLCKLTNNVNTLADIYNNVENVIKETTNNWLIDHYAELMLNAFYVEDDEQIIFSTSMKSLDVHTYNGTDTMTINQLI